MRFTADRKKFEYALVNPFEGCQHVEHAAYGRASEFYTTYYASIALNASIMTLYGVASKPYAHIISETIKNSILTEECRHDGLVFELFDLRNFLGAHEAKLQIFSGRVFLSSREIPVLNYCRENGFAYYISLSKLISKNSLECEYIQTLDAVTNDGLVTSTGEILTSRFSK